MASQTMFMSQLVVVGQGPWQNMLTKSLMTPQRATSALLNLYKASLRRFAILAWMAFARALRPARWARPTSMIPWEVDLRVYP